MRKVHQAKDKLGKLTSLLRGSSTLLIVMQDNPDPDAIAASAALKELAKRSVGVTCSVAYGGTIGRAENRELAHYLGFTFHPFRQIDPGQFDLIALVDTQPGTGNNPLSAEVLPDIVIDHHPIRRATRRVPFTDVRSNYGATSTILWEYLSEAQIVPDLRLATALLYGIRSDTQDLGRESGKADIEAMEALYPLTNKRMLSQIQRGRVPSAYYQMLATALANTTIYGHCAISDLRDVENPDMIGEVADLLLRHEKVNWTLCYGVHAGKILLSLRTQDTQHDAGEVMRRIVNRIGTGGGHASMAGGQISLRPDADREADRARLERLIRDRLFRALRVTRRRGTQLVKLEDKRRKG